MGPQLMPAGELVIVPAPSFSMVRDAILAIPVPCATALIGLDDSFISPMITPSEYPELVGWYCSVMEQLADGLND